MRSRAKKTFSMVLLAVACGLSSHADDSAVSVAAGGIRLSKEARISMEKEVLKISDKTVAVDFDFLNESDSDVTTEVGFPIPPYENGEWGEPGLRRDFSDFRVWIDGREIKYQTDVRAKLDGKDYTDLLRKLGFEIDFALNDDNDDLATRLEGTFASLSASDQSRLVSLGLVKPGRGDHYFEWAVYKEYHWRQTFPEHRMVHIRHEYTPEVGYEQIEVGKIQADLKNSCIDDGLERALKANVDHRSESEPKGFGQLVFPEWVDYILTSANTWKTPIKSFELVVERPKPDKNHQHCFVSFCWDGKIEQRDADHFVAHISNFVPKHELRIYFLSPD